MTTLLGSGCLALCLEEGAEHPKPGPEPRAAAIELQTDAIARGHWHPIAGVRADKRPPHPATSRSTTARRPPILPRAGSANWLA
jgi:hypothetical protein